VVWTKWLISNNLPLIPAISGFLKTGSPVKIASQKGFLDRHPVRNRPKNGFLRRFSSGQELPDDFQEAVFTGCPPKKCF
jgi:hypothetical protein